MDTQTYNIGIGDVQVIPTPVAGKFKVVLQLDPFHHVRTIRTEMLDGRVSLIAAKNSEAANALRREVIEGKDE